MARTQWSDVINRQSSFHLLTGRLHEDFADGPQEQFDQQRLRFGANLLKRCCAGLKLQGAVSVHGSREGSQTVVLTAVEDAADFVQLTTLTSAAACRASPWKGQGQFVLDEALHIQLLEIAGPPDEKGAGRRAHERRVAEKEDRSLRWAVSGRKRDCL